MTRRWWAQLALGLVAAGLLIWTAVYLYWPDEKPRLVVCDVGQGDGILITYGFQQIMIDAGQSEEKMLECLGEYVPWWDRTLELVVMTHPDADHIGGMAGVLSRYTVRTILFNGDAKDTMVFKEAMQAIHDQYKHGAQVKVPILGLQWRFYLEKTQKNEDSVSNSHPLTLTVLSPRVEVDQTTVENWLKTETLLWDKAIVSQVLAPETEQSNDRSIVLLLEYGKTSVLLTGDLEEEGELSLLAEGVIHQVDILKAGHHGSKTSSSWDFIKALGPELSLVSAGENNRYGHPSPEVMTRFDQFGIQTLRTDQRGTIEVVFSGDEYTTHTDH